MISKYKQSDWFFRFLIMLSQQAQDFGRSAPDPYIIILREGGVWERDYIFPTKNA